MTAPTTPDVVIIGSGAGGGTAAWALSSAGMHVLLLEAGPAYDPAKDYNLHKNNWERSRFPEKIPTGKRQTFAPLQKLDHRWKHLRSWNRVTGPYNLTDRRTSWGYLHVVGLGGSTLHFTGEAHRMHPDAMRMHSRFGVAADWPLDYAELEPYYNRAERIVGVAGPKKDPIRWRSEPYPLPAHALSYTSQIMQNGCRKLGLSLTPNPVATLSLPYDGRPNCNYCGNCARGCPRRDKGSVDVTFIHKALATGFCSIKTGCRVTHIEAGENDRVTGVHYLDERGSHFVPCRTLIVACGAVETPRLLLNSEGRHAPTGLANESGQVGKHFMETLFWNSNGLHPEPLGSFRGLPSDSICWDYNAPDAIADIIGGCRFTPNTAEADLIGPINYAKRVVEGWGHTHKQRMRETFGRIIGVGSIGESLPNPNSFIDLDPKKKDIDGLPLARIHSHLDEREIRRLDFMAGQVRAILKASGVDELVEEYGTYDAFSATHVFGTCRMGRDAESSVVDSDCRSHRWRNLFIMDASVFPSSGGGESPSLTIEALAIRAAERLVEQAKRRGL